MPLSWEEANEAVRDARITIRNMEDLTREMAAMIGGKLQSGNVSGFTLRRLKEELKRYNMHTNTWRSS